MSLVNVLFNPLRSIVYSEFGASMRWALKFDGIGVRGQLAQRAINPDGDIDIEWEQLDYDTTSFGASSIVTQCLTATFASRELMLRIEANESIALYFGGNVVTTPVNFYGTGKWRITLIGSSLVVYKNGLVVYSTSFTRGTAREPSAQTVIGARNSGGTFVDYKKGTLYNVKINGTRWPMADRNQVIQLPQPSGLGVERLTNSSLSNNAQSWTKDNITALSLGNNSARLTNTIASYAGGIQQTFPTVSGTEYVVRLKVLAVSATAPATTCRVSCNAGTSGIYNGSLFAANFTVSDQYLFIKFTATSTQSTVKILCNTAEATGFVEISEVTVRPLGTCNPMTINNATSANWMQVVDDYDPKFRKVLNFDGVGARGVLAKRAIDPDGDIDIEFQTGPVVPVAGGGIEYTVLSQCLTSTFASKEFNLYFNSSAGALQMQVGGAYSASSASVTLSPNTIYRALLQGTSLKFFKNGQSLLSTSFTRGAERESTAQTVIGANTHGAPTTFRASALGMFYNIKINGTLWPIADANQTIQLPSPTGLGAELITPTVLENPAVKGTQWTYLGDGRWQYIGDGSYNPLRFIASTEQPNAAYLEYEVESITGTITTAFNNPSAVVSTVGIKRYFFTGKGVNEANVFEFKRASGGIVAACIIKNISFKPLGTCNPITLANVTSANWEDLEI